MLCALFVYVVSIVRSFCGAVSFVGGTGRMERWGLTEISNPILRARALTSSRLSSTEVSPELLFSQCQRSGPVSLKT